MKIEDLIAGGKVTGSVAMKLMASGMNVNCLRTNATLLKDEWKQIDAAVLQAARQRFVGVADLQKRGLVYRFPNGLGKTVLEYQDMSELSAAEISMDGVTVGKNDRNEFELKYLPLPIIHKEFQLGIRALTASRQGLMPLDTTNAEQCARKCAEKVEQLLFNGSGNFAYGGGTIYGYCDAPNRNIGDLMGKWDDSSVDGEDILEDVRKMKQDSINALHYGPWILYIPTEYETKLDEDFKANSDKTIRQRILEIAGIEDVRVADYLTAGNVVLVQMTTDVVRLVEGLPITNIEWQTQGNMMFHFKVMTIQVGQVRADQNGKSGVVHYSEP